MSKYFSLKEMTASETAKTQKIENIPPYEVEQNLKELMGVLDCFREYYGHPVRVSSGYRGQLLNKIVGGSPTSAHCIGYAADLQPIEGTFENFKGMFLEWLGTGIHYDQCIIERSKSSEWVHFGLYNREGKQRMQHFSMDA